MKLILFEMFTYHIIRGGAIKVNDYYTEHPRPWADYLDCGTVFK